MNIKTLLSKLAQARETEAQANLMAAEANDILAEAKAKRAEANAARVKIENQIIEHCKLSDSEQVEILASAIGMQRKKARSTVSRETIKNKIFEKIKKAGRKGITRRDLTRAARDADMQMRDDIIKELEEAGAILVDVSLTATRPATVYTANRAWGTGQSGTGIVDRETLKNQVLAKIKKAGRKGITKRNLTRVTQAIKMHTRAGIINDLKEAGDIVVYELGTATRPATVYAANRQA